MQNRKRVHVAVAVIYGDDGRILIARRPDDKHQGGLWEFPGGKVEPEEDVCAALQRELQEELAIQVSEFKRLIRIRHDYADKSVLLDTWEVSGITGEPRGNEGQSIRWIEADQLHTLPFPQANKPIIQAIQLPDRYMVTGRFEDDAELFSKVQRQLAKDIQLVQFRAPWLSPPDYLRLAERLSVVVREQGARLMVKGSLDLLKKPWCDGLHLTAKQLLSTGAVHKSSGNQLLVASCHNSDELAQAQKMGADFVTLSPVQQTRTHPEAEPLGMERVAELTEFSPLPVYWLGGLAITDIEKVKIAGAQGVAAISEFWS